MATTIQKPPHPSQMDPRMRRAVYAKYREMLVSKHNQANDMIKQLPAYMVREDRGFNTNIIVNDVPPPPPIPGNMPAHRLQTQMSEAPACVQNAMMTKDKKPFTYTPGGIDLSQIKSPRMAKRISANANSPGVSSTPKISPLAQINNNNGNNSPAIQTPSTPGVPPPPPPMPSMGSLAMGMPFQVFPTGPSPVQSKTPQQQPQQQQLSAPQTNGTNARKSPQSFDPPPMGCRPEIKIPENPMAILRKVPKPQQKDDYWIQEYVQERNSAPTEESIREQIIQSPIIQQYSQQQKQPQQQQEFIQSPPPPPPPIQQQQQQKPSTPITPQFTPQKQQFKSASPPLERSEINIPIRNLKLDEIRSASPTRVQVNVNQSSSPIHHINPSSSSSSSSPVTVTSAKSVTIEPINKQSQQNYQQQQQQASQQGSGRIILSTMPNRQNQAQQNLGSLYIPPPPSMDDKQYLLNQQSPPWMSSSSKQQQAYEPPEWVNRDEIDNFIQQTRIMQQPPQSAAAHKEHIIPISVEKSPTRTPSQNFGPTPFYGPTPQHVINNVISPKVDPNANKFVNQGYNNIEYPQQQQQQQQQQHMRPYVQTNKQQQQQQPQQPAGTRIIPIHVEGARAMPQNENSIVIQSDPRSPQSPRIIPGVGLAPTQSRSFKILQQVTGTLGNDDSDDNESKPKNKSEDDDAPMQEQRPIYSRPLGPNDMSESQLRRMQMSDNDRAFMNRIKTQVDDEVYLHSECDPRYKGSAIPSKAFKCLQTMIDGASNNNIQAAPADRQNQKNTQDDVNEQPREPGLYQGSAIPSRSFKILQSMTQPENAAENSFNENNNSDIEGNSCSYSNNHINSEIPLNCYQNQNCHNNQPNNHYNHCIVPQPQLVPPYMMPPQYAAYYDWYDPQNNPWAAYYYPGFDSNYFGYPPPPPPQPSHSRSQTPQPQSQQQQQQQPPPPMPYFYPAYPPPFVILPPFMGFRPISASRETTPCYSEAERYQTMSTSTNDDRNRRAVSCTPTCCQHAKSFQVENLNNKFHTFEEPIIPIRSMSVQSDAMSSSNNSAVIEHPPEPPENRQNEGFPLPTCRSLKSIPSVSNINMFNDDCDLEELLAKPIITNCDDDDDVMSETSEDTTEVEEEISQDTETVEVHYPHQLSVIYEENESAANERRSSICSRSSTLSDCSTTLMEEDNISVDDNSADELEDENSNSVTVRLPLKFSFTRSKDNMVNTTLTVGESESKVVEIHPEKSPSPMPVIQSHSLSNNSSANDVSVTFSLKSKSKSKTPERLIAPTLSVKCDSIEERDDDDDNECSVSISLPRRKSKSIECEIKVPTPPTTTVDDENSENSSDNKNYIDNSLYTSIDAMEEIKKGMAEINNSLFSRICTLRKSAINIPEHEHNGNRSGSVSYIDSIESDSEGEENEVELSYNEQKNSVDSDFIINDVELKEIDDDENEPKIIEETNQEEDDDEQQEEEIDFWSQISPTKDKDEDYNLSKTSTRSSRYWFEDETEDNVAIKPIDDDGFAHYETNDITTSISFVSINDAATINDDNNDEVDFWKDYDSDKDDYVSKSKKFFESDDGAEKSHIDETEMSIYDDPIQAESRESTPECNAIESEFKRSATPFKDSDNKSEFDDDSDTESCKAYDDLIEISKMKNRIEMMRNEYENEKKKEKFSFMNREIEQKEIQVDDDLEYDDKIEELQDEVEKVTNLEPENYKNKEQSIVIEEEPIKNIQIEESRNEVDKMNLESEISETKEDSIVFEAEQNEVEKLTNLNSESNKIKKESIKPIKVEEKQSVVQKYQDYELESDEEWTEEEIEESEYEEEIQPAVIKEKEIKNIQIEQNNIVVVDNDDEESEYEYEYEEEEIEEEEEEDISEHKEAAQKPLESEQVEDEKIIISNSNNSSNSRLTKGKSLVNVNSFIQSESDREKIKEMKERIDIEESESSDESVEEVEDEDEDKIDSKTEPTIGAAATIQLPNEPKSSSSNDNNLHSNDDCHDVLTPYIISSQSSSNINIINNNDDKVLLSNLTQIHSVDSKSNMSQMTSESGISFEQNDADSEDGYEEDSDEEIINDNNDENKTKNEMIIPHLDDSTFVEQSTKKEIKVNVKGKISMFERAMSEEKTTPIVEKSKDIPKVAAKYSFRHNRESSEPPINHKNETVLKRAVSELKEVPKNEKLSDLVNKRKPSPLTDAEMKSVREKISSFEQVLSIEQQQPDANEKREIYRRYGNSKEKNSSIVRSIDESGEEDSGVTSDFCKQSGLSENETDSENFPELRKLSRYERASTHSRLFKLLQGDDEEGEPPQKEKEEAPKEKEPITTKVPYKSKKIIHNVSVTRRQNPQAAIQAETMEERRQRLCLPLTHQSSSGAESMSSSTTPSPTPAINEKLVQELVQSLLSQKRGKAFSNLPIEKLHAAAVKILQEDMESNGSTFSSADESAIPTVDSTPALTPQEFRNNSSYAEYYDSWQSGNGNNTTPDDLSDVTLIQSKAFRNLQEQQNAANKKLWSVRCPRILSSKSINKDLARLSEVRESESPEPTHSRSPSIRSMSTEPMSGDNNKNHHHHNHHQERLKAANT